MIGNILTTILTTILAVCGLGWIYLAARNERMKAVSGNTRHFIKTSSPGWAALMVAGIVFIRSLS